MPSALRSVVAVLAGVVAIAVLSTISDTVMHKTGVFPPLGEPMLDPGLNLLALGYRMLYTVLGGYLTARMAPKKPMSHVLALGVLGLVVGIAAAAAAMAGPALLTTWFLVALPVTALPCAWLGGVVQRSQRAEAM